MTLARVSIVIVRMAVSICALVQEVFVSALVTNVRTRMIDDHPAHSNHYTKQSLIHKAAGPGPRNHPATDEPARTQAVNGPPAGEDEAPRCRRPLMTPLSH